ncbi:MAG: hypothetical protein FD131_3266 [Rhodocyclaceae bacterium]|nr:MAG: hypothetical protein FD131_3266 [Rhodocyclaceae bacterium]
MMTTSLDTFIKAELAGIGLTVSVPVVGGFQEMRISPQQAERYLALPHAVQAELLGFTEAEFAEYGNSCGTVFCESATSKGKACRNNVAGRTLLSPDEWKKCKAEGGYCSAHGGS